MNITEWCQSPQNRIELMEEIINRINKANGIVYCCITIVFIIENTSKYKHIDPIGYINAYPRDKSNAPEDAVLSELLPELHKYANPSFTWFDNNNARAQALHQAIQDIKSQYNL